MGEPLPQGVNLSEIGRISWQEWQLYDHGEELQSRFRNCDFEELCSLSTSVDADFRVAANEAASAKLKADGLARVREAISAEVREREFQESLIRRYK